MSIRTGQPPAKLNEADFKKQFLKSFYDPSFDPFRESIDRLAEQAWQNYSQSRKAPITAKAGPGFSDPDYQLSVQWRKSHDDLNAAQAQWKTSPLRILVINGSSRNEHTCPGEIPKSFRFAEMAIKRLADAGIEGELLDLSRVTAEYGKKIYPCKACVSTAMPLCHWPCSCYPNHSLGQVHDWMDEIYLSWVKAHGVLIITPVHWYQAPSPLKLMIDRLVCADGGNPDPTSTQGKKAKIAKEIELKGWDYPMHLAGRAFSIIAHGDVIGAENVRRNLVDWLTDLELVPAGSGSAMDGYIGYYEPYAVSHEALDKDEDFIKDVDNAVTALIGKVSNMRADGYAELQKQVRPARKK